MRISLILTIICFSIVGCGPLHHNLSTGQFTKDQIVSLRNEYPAFRIIKVDGMIGPNGPLWGYSAGNGLTYLKLDPGVHTFGLLYWGYDSSFSYQSNGEVTMSAIFEANHNYVVKAGRYGDSLEGYFYFWDETKKLRLPIDKSYMFSIIKTPIPTSTQQSYGINDMDRDRKAMEMGKQIFFPRRR